MRGGCSKVKTRSTKESGIMFLSVLLPRDGRSIGEGDMRVKASEGKKFFVKKFFVAFHSEAWYIPCHGKILEKRSACAPFFQEA